MIFPFGFFLCDGAQLVGYLCFGTKSFFSCLSSSSDTLDGCICKIRCGWDIRTHEGSAKLALPAYRQYGHDLVREALCSCVGVAH